MAQSAPVVEGVITHLMSVSDNLFVQLRILAYIIANHEERCLHTILAERFKDEGSTLGYGTVVKGYIYSVLLTIHSPGSARVHPPYPGFWLFYYH
jgi:hypothetical protein